MVVGGSQQETLDLGFVLLGTRQRGVPVILRELVLPDGFDPINHLTSIRHSSCYLLIDIQFASYSLEGLQKILIPLSSAKFYSLCPSIIITTAMLSNPKDF
ncbi:unnamed protein product [Schistosoma margrebowiei]|uniref:Uncharacterized protein n=1 Tax=Schistosoma margrebowiei TaxID=48269 RepID=A0A183N6G7_9TREM|nr:unnamed protein product [Schistosoma margrebowiei]